MRVSVRGVTKRFGEVVALDGVDFELPAGRRVALVGPNGSGKSTLNRILMGLVSCEGEVRLDGRCPFRERVSIAKRMAHVPQIAPQLAASVDELVRALLAVRGVDPENFVSLAAGLDLDVGALARRPFRSLSGGNKQKLLIALAFASEASLLVLDEPTASLDAHGRERFFELFDALPAGTTLVLCSHRLDEIRPLVEEVLVLDEGRLAWHGSASALLASGARALVEVWVNGEVAGDWLRERGFRRAAAGPWLRSVSQAEKMKLVEEIPRELGPALANLNARDLETLDLSRRAPGRSS